MSGTRSRFRGMMLVLAAAVLGACVISADVDTRRPLVVDASALPEIDVARLAYRTEVTAKSRVYLKEFDVVVLDEDRFGGPGAVADPGCLAEGLGLALADVTIVSTERFWREVLTGFDEVPLAALFEPPHADRMTALGLDYLVLATYRQEPLESEVAEVVVEGMVRDSKRLRARALLVDPRAALPIDIAEASVVLDQTFAHYLFVLPLVMVEKPRDNPCHQVAVRLAETIRERQGDGGAAIAVLAARGDLVEAARSAPRLPVSEPDA